MVPCLDFSMTPFNPGLSTATKAVPSPMAFLMASHSAKPQLLSMIPSKLVPSGRLLRYQVQLPTSGTTSAASGTQQLFVEPEETLPRFHLTDAALFLVTKFSDPASIVPLKQEFHVSGVSPLSQVSLQSKPIRTLLQNLSSKYHMAPIESLPPSET